MGNIPLKIQQPKPSLKLAFWVLLTWLGLEEYLEMIFIALWVGQLLISFLDSSCPSELDFLPHFVNIVVASGPPHLKSVVRSKQGHARCKIH